MATKKSGERLKRVVDDVQTAAGKASVQAGKVIDRAKDKASEAVREGRRWADENAYDAAEKLGTDPKKTARAFRVTIGVLVVLFGGLAWFVFR